MSTQSMKAIRVHDYGNADQLKLEQVQRPAPQAGEVLVQVHAAGVNPIDWKVRQGLRKEIVQMQFPYIPGMEIAGVVQEIGPGVTAFQKGQDVYLGVCPDAELDDFPASADHTNMASSQ